MSRFDQWWDTGDHMARHLPDSTKVQIKDYLREAFNAGIAAAKNNPRGLSQSALDYEATVGKP